VNNQKVFLVCLTPKMRLLTADRCTIYFVLMTSALEIRAEVKNQDMFWMIFKTPFGID